ncbi:MAG TPA: RidA family protein [Acidimicrobiia bacterium]|nr:RidA family protein [Acidimicrobiia bacterium]
MEIQPVEVSGVAPPGGHYTHGLVARAARWLFVAGQVALDETGQLVGEGDAEAQADQVLANLDRVITAAGGTRQGVVKTTVYLVDLADRAAVGRARQRFFPSPPPTNTLLVVESLAQPQFLVEIEAIVALPEP